jgi:Ran GTPase-activating protein (RanGAP) involved in mRNA processing and transport
MIAAALKSCRQLEVLRLTESRIEDDCIRIIIKCLLKHPSLKVLDLRHNRLKDRGGRAIGKVSFNSLKIILLIFTNNYDISKLFIIFWSNILCFI